MTCSELAHSFSFFLPGKKKKEENNDQSQVKRLNALMQTFFFMMMSQVSLPIRLPKQSGIGGGIVALFPKIFVVATWSPKLNKKGNSNWECMH
jgi:glutaminase